VNWKSPVLAVASAILIEGLNRLITALDSIFLRSNRDGLMRGINTMTLYLH